jgi:Cupin-like domain
MFDRLRQVEEIECAGLDASSVDTVSGGRPAVLRRAFARWPFVRAALQSDEAAVEYLERFYGGRPVGMMVAPPSERGRFFYRPDSKQMNFERSTESLSRILHGLLQQRNAEQPFGVAMQAIPVPEILPGVQEDNPNPFVPEGVPPRLWIGNRVSVSPHFDVADNLACVVAGRRRFILFPPEQTANLYPGPMDVTPSSVPISMVSLDEPDLERFPRYREALDSAYVAELEPGDAIAIPYLWWHGVQSLSPFNVLMNYWWNRDPAAARYPFVPLLRLVYMLYEDMPPEHRNAWRALYDHYVFEEDGDPMEPLSPPHRDDRRKVDPDGATRLRQLIRELLG